MEEPSGAFLFTPFGTLHKIQHAILAYSLHVIYAIMAYFILDKYAIMSYDGFMNLKELRCQGNITQREASEITGIPLRTYLRYENDDSKSDSLKYMYAMERLAEYAKTDEEHGILTIDDIRGKLEPILKNHGVEYCILFGSYAKNLATERSDVDLLIRTNLTGLSFYGLVEEIQQSLHKKTDLLRIEDIVQNTELVSEILKYGVKIYG